MTSPTSPPLTRPMGPLDPKNGLRRRLQLTGLAFVYVLLAVPALLLLVLLTVSLSVITAVGLGLLLLLVFVPLNRKLAGVHRYLGGLILGVHIEADYAEPAGPGPLALLRTWARDPTRWRDYLWTWASATAGWVLAWLSLGLGLLLLWYVAFPFVYWVTPDGVLDMNYGVVRIDSVRRSFLEWVWLLLAVPLWWWLVPILMRWRAEIDRHLLSPSRVTLERRVAEVSESRAETIDHSAAELRRIERDLHDGAQARVVSVGMSIGMAEQLLATDPEGAAKLLREARSTNISALGDLRSVVRGIHPPVLSDRGLAGAVQALALDLPVPISVLASLAGRAPAPVESAVYFAIAECLANIGKHARAARGAVELTHDGGVMRAVVADDGRGGAAFEKGTGLAGVARRLASFDGTMAVQSPAGGPTVVTMELPCVLSSPRTSPSSGTA